MPATISTMHLETERLIIRPYAEDDLMESFELMQNPELFTYLHMDVMPLENYKRLFHWLRSSYDTPFDKPFKYSVAIREKATGRFSDEINKIAYKKGPAVWQPLHFPF
ncbi:hypothetical protein EMIT07CA2_10043 [Brevibacillus sp. IT-7CA2]|uniref:GNAT family N-acetyltransferase n=1 Tax=Brevibacillus sp. IT-7CA2 TaxID=3026436 RepID=UPI0039E116E1